MTLTIETGRRQKVAAAAYRMRHHVAQYGRGAGPGLRRPGARRRRHARRRLRRPTALPGRGSALGRTGPVPAVHRSLRDRAVRRAGRSGHHRRRRTRHLRIRRVPAADVRNGKLHTRHGDLRRLTGPRPDRGGRHGFGSAPPGFVVAGDQLPLRRRAGRGLHLGSRDGRQPSPARQSDRAWWTSTRCRPTAPPPACCAPSRSPTNGPPAAGSFSRVDGNDVDALLAAFDAVAARRALTGTPSVILCDTRVGRGVPLLENREKAHFMRIDADEWQLCRDQLTAGLHRKWSKHDNRSTTDAPRR